MDVKRYATVIDTAKRHRDWKVSKWCAEDFQVLVSTNADAMVVLDHDGFVLYVNLAAESLFSLPSAEMVGANFGFPIIMDKPVELHILREFKDFVGAEMRMVEVKWAGEPSYLLSFRDLTDRINAEQALSRSRDELDAKVNVRTQELSETNESLKREIAERKFIEERLAYVASFPELNPNPLFEMDKSGVIKYSNPAANRIFPDLREKGMDHPLLRGITFGVFKEKREIVRDVYINDTAYQQSIYYLADRKTLRIYIRDITERKRAEDALREQSILLNLSPDGIIARNLDGKIAFWSKGAEALYGWKEQEAIGQVTHFLLKTVFPCTLEDINRGLLQTGGWSGELAHTAKDGRQIIVQSSWLVRYDDKGNIKNILESNVNITERKQAEEKLLEAKQQAELYLDLMGHDINNMHQIALGYLEIAQELIQADEAQKELLDKPVEVLQRSARLIQNVRKLQKINEGVFQSKEVDVCQMLVDVQRELGSVPNKAITLNLNGCDRCLVSANDLLYDVFTNLVGNAIKHTGNRADIHIGLDLVNDNGGLHCRVSVKDNGPGVPDDFKGVIFNRVPRGTNKAKGMGLGLYLVKSLAESYGGKVWVEDRVPGDHTKGARFVVMLPVVEN